mgnify:FL=1
MLFDDVYMCQSIDSECNAQSTIIIKQHQCYSPNILHHSEKENFHGVYPEILIQVGTSFQQLRKS